MILNIEEIKKLIPHREPFLFIDTCNIKIPGEYGVSSKVFKENEYFFKGHFPNNPIVPGVIIVEAMAQTAACLMSYSNKGLQKQKAVFLTGIENTKFKKMTTPGDILKLKVKVISNRKKFYKFSANAHIEDVLVAIILALFNIFLKKYLKL